MSLPQRQEPRSIEFGKLYIFALIKYFQRWVEEECIYESVSVLILFLIQGNQCNDTNGLLHHKVEIIMLFVVIVLRKATQILYIKQQIICQTTDTHHTTSFNHQYLYKNM